MSVSDQSTWPEISAHDDARDTEWAPTRRSDIDAQIYNTDNYRTYWRSLSGHQSRQSVATTRHYTAHRSGRCICADLSIAVCVLSGNGNLSSARTVHLCRQSVSWNCQQRPTTNCQQHSSDRLTIEILYHTHIPIICFVTVSHHTPRTSEQSMTVHLIDRCITNDAIVLNYIVISYYLQWWMVFDVSLPDRRAIVLSMWLRKDY